ncbi:hypothetical protein D9756_008347 [Leucocoprinus leucothites]|uniref:F-box domain-containing protein n=1 Tax=Leucocoprinus leucothites TaxID=201217 RepID=A0A8H5D0X1_9AGAR|nr:hypothetical protein D9756_008347 [Leucoagaricus leucothites]
MPLMSFFSPWNLYQWLIAQSLVRKNNSRTSYIRSRAHELLSLPDELLVDILTRLDCPDIYSARVACKKLYQITKSRHLWFGVIRRLQLERGLVPPEEGISQYSAEQLEDWTLRRSTPRATLESQHQVQPHARLIDLRTQDIDDFVAPLTYLLPGGRWFLLAHSSSRTLVYDLDSTNAARKCLFNVSDFDKDLTSEYIRHTLWFDYSNPCLSFYVAASPFNKNNARSIIYAVQLSGKGANATLIASFVAAFRSSGQKGWYLGQLALNKRYYVEVRRDPNNRKIQDVLAYEFQHASGSNGYCSIKPAAQTRFVGDRICLTAFIYDDVLAMCTSRDVIQLYDIVGSDPTTCCSSSAFKLLHTVSFSFHFCSNIRWSPLESYMVSITREGEFKGLRIPHDRTIPPTVMELGRHEKFLNHRPGWKLDTSISISLDDHNGPVDIIYHPWTNVRDGSSVSNYFRRLLGVFKVPYIWWGARVVGFSEDLGRLVFFKDGSETWLVVVDLAAPRYLHE